MKRELLNWRVETWNVETIFTVNISASSQAIKTLECESIKPLHENWQEEKDNGGISFVFYSPLDRVAWNAV